MLQSMGEENKAVGLQMSHYHHYRHYVYSSHWNYHLSPHSPILPSGNPGNDVKASIIVASFHSCVKNGYADHMCIFLERIQGQCKGCIH